MTFCKLEKQGIPQGACLTDTPEGLKPACQVTLRKKNGMFERLIKSMHLSRPEDYFSVYQSGCNHSCLKCHSADFSKSVKGESTWISSEDLAMVSAVYLEDVTVEEPKERVTMYHAEDLCLHCGSCLLQGERSPNCPGVLEPDQIRLSPQGWGPARNIIAFTGGDLFCNPEYYVQVVERTRDIAGSSLWFLGETNGYALTEQNVEILRTGGLDGFWFDIKAYDSEKYKQLCGTDNKTVLEAPALIYDAGFTLEILTLFIPGLVETDQHYEIAKLVTEIDPAIPTTLLAFFPAYKMLDNRPPTTAEMVRSYLAMKEAGLKKIRLGNLGVFVKTEKQFSYLRDVLGPDFRR